MKYRIILPIISVAIMAAILILTQGLEAIPTLILSVVGFFLLAGIIYSAYKIGIKITRRK